MATWRGNGGGPSRESSTERNADFSLLPAHRDAESKSPPYIQSVRDVAEFRRAQDAARFGELRGVCHVDALGAERHAPVGADRPDLRYRGIHVFDAAAAKRIRAQVAFFGGGRHECKR